jgi:dipeptidyl aminopeptidase/acylaminoacyl peptidase
MTERKLIPRKVLLGNPDRAMVRLSPGGRWLSWLASEEGVLNVWVAPAGEPHRAKPVTHDRGRGIQSYAWAHTDRHVLYLQDANGDENWRVYCLDVETEEKRDLTPQSGVQARIEGVSPRHPGAVLIALNDRDPRFHDLYRVDIATGHRELVQRNDGFLMFIADDDYQVQFASRFCPDGSTELLARAGEGWTPFLQVPAEDTIGTQPVGLDAAGRVLFMLDSRGRDTAAAVSIALAAGEKTVLAEDEQADAEEVLVHPLNKHVQAVAFTYARRRWAVVDPEVDADVERLARAAQGDFTVVSRTTADDRWIVAYDTDRRPLEYYLYDRTRGETRFLFSNREELADRELAATLPVVVRSRDGLPLVSYLTLPRESDPGGAGRPQRPLPTVLLVHGGPWSRDRYAFNPLHQWLADRGYAVLSVNFRGSTGFGKRFVNAGDREWGGAMHDDLVAAVRWAVAEGVSDPARVAIMGGSYGGYATLVGLTFTADLFACGVDIVGPSNLVTLLQNIPPYWAPMFPLLAQRVGDPNVESDREFLRQRSPLTYVDRIRRPLLIGQGANDPRVKKVESDQIVEAMQARGIPVTYVLYPDEGHGFVRPENRLSFFAIAEAFLAQFLGGEAQPFEDALEGSSLQVLTGVEHVPGLSEEMAKSGR